MVERLHAKQEVAGSKPQRTKVFFLFATRPTEYNLCTAQLFLVHCTTFSKVLQILCRELHNIYTSKLEVVHSQIQQQQQQQS